VALSSHCPYKTSISKYSEAVNITRFYDLSELSEIIYYDIIFNYNVFATIKFVSIVINIIF
jgi:hypothetical protein